MFTQADIENYYSAFKHAHLFLIILGSISLITAIFFYFRLKTAGHKGFAVPLFVSALLFCTAGFGNFTSARQLSIRAAYNYDMHPELFRAKELARITELQKRLTVLTDVNAVIIALSLLLFFYFRKKRDSDYYKGAAASLFLMGVISTAIYFIMLQSARSYGEKIERFISPPVHRN